MNKLICISFLMLMATLAYSQVTWINNNVEVTVLKNTSLHIEGSLVCNSTFGKSDFFNTGSIEVTENLVANSPSGCLAVDGSNQGKIIFNGKQNQKITGNEPITFKNLEIKKQGGKVILEKDILITDSLMMSRGNLFLNSHHITLKPSFSSQLYFENENSKVEDTLAGYISTKIVKNNITTADNILGLKIDAPSLSQGIEVSRYHYKDTTVAAGSIDRVYVVTTIPQEKINILSFTYFDTELNSIAENNLNLFTRINNSAWEKDTNTTINTQTNTIISPISRTLTGKLWITLSSKNCEALALNFTNGIIQKCQFDSLVISPSTAYQRYQWSNGINSPSITVKKSDVYTLLATDGKGCIALDSVKVKFNSLPLSDFRASVACGAKDVAFYNQSQSLSPLTYQWDLGDKTQSSQTSPLHLYDSLISYKVVLKATDEFGCSDTTSKMIDVASSQVLMKAQFLFASKIFAQDSVKFIQLTQPEPRAFDWSFGDGSQVDSTYSPNHVFNTPGIYTIRLSASNNGCTDVLVKTIEVLKNEKLRNETSDVFSNLFVPLEAFIFPSLENKQISIQLKSFDKNTPVSIYAYNALGQTMYQDNLPNEALAHIAVENWTDGTYIIGLVQNEQTLYKKILVGTNK